MAEINNQVERLTYAFLSPYRCPLCHSLQTAATATRGRIQLRACRHCGCRFKQIGSPI